MQRTIEAGKNLYDLYFCDSNLRIRTVTPLQYFIPNLCPRRLAITVDIRPIQYWLKDFHEVSQYYLTRQNRQSYPSLKQRIRTLVSMVKHLRATCYVEVRLESSIVFFAGAWVAICDDNFVFRGHGADNLSQYQSEVGSFVSEDTFGHLVEILSLFDDITTEEFYSESLFPFLVSLAGLVADEDI